MQSVQGKINSFFNSKRFNLFAFILIATLVLISYSNTFHSAFHFDDTPSIVDNQGIRRLNWDSFWGQFSGTRPIVNLSLLLNYQLSGLNVVASGATQDDVLAGTEQFSGFQVVLCNFPDNAILMPFKGEKNRYINDVLLTTIPT